MSKIKRLFFDIETSPNIGLFWSAGYKQNIDHNSIIKERSIICIAYKWAYEKTTHVITWDKNQDDKQMLEKFINIANTADEIVAHNGDKFDLPWIRTRCLFHRIEMFPNYVSIDTLKVARNKFKFNSNKLDYIAKFLQFESKLHVGYDIWKSILLNNCRKSLN
jgi:DNA polymerase elongation subunit (family B)